VGAKLTPYATIFKGSEKRGKLAAQETFLQTQGLRRGASRRQDKGFQSQTQDGTAAALFQEISPANPFFHLRKTVEIDYIVNGKR